MNEIRFRVDERRKTVTCKLLNCRFIPMKRMLKYAPSYYLYVKPIAYAYTGVAKCAPEDTFDPEVGKKIALTRAKAKRAKAINASIQDAISQMERDLVNLRNFAIHKVPEI